MKKISFYMIFASCLLTSCDEQIDFSNPKSITEKYYSFIFDGKQELEYELIADTCKEFVTLQDYFDHNTIRDSAMKEYSFIVQKINQLTIDPTEPKYRHYEIEYIQIKQIDKDTTIRFSYSTVFNEKGKWKIIWTGNISRAAKKLMQSQKFSEAIETYQKVLQYNPLDGDAYQEIGWCQYRQGNDNLALKNARKAVELSPKDESNYNLLAGIYSSQGNQELAIENYKKAIDMTQSEKQKVHLMSNSSIAYMNLFKYKEAKKILNEALSIDSTDTHTLWQKGELYRKEGEIDSAIICYKNAISFSHMDDFLQKKLYFDLAYSEYEKARLIQYKNSERVKILNDAKTHILKALDFEYDNSQYINLLEDIKKLN